MLRDILAARDTRDAKKAVDPEMTTETATLADLNREEDITTKIRARIRVLAITRLIVLLVKREVIESPAQLDTTALRNVVPLDLLHVVLPEAT